MTGSFRASIPVKGMLGVRGCHCQGKSQNHQPQGPPASPGVQEDGAAPLPEQRDRAGKWPRKNTIVKNADSSTLSGADQHYLPFSLQKRREKTSPNY